MQLVKEHINERIFTQKITYYVYLITNSLLNKQYVGSKICYKDHCNDNYWGSSKYLYEDIEKYGIENFTKEILKDDYENSRDMLDGETKYILEYNTLTPNGYNRFLPNQRKGFHTAGVPSGMKGKHHTKESLDKMKKIKLQEKNPFFRKHHTKETTKNMSLKRLGKKFTEEHKNNMSKSFSGEGNSMYGKYGKDNPNFGSKRTEETKQKMRGRIKSEKELEKIREENRKKIRCPYCNKEVDKRNYKKWHGEKCKYKM